MGCTDMSPAVKIELMDCENHILEEIADKDFKRNDVAVTYAFCITSSEKPNFGRINRAIRQRWSRGGLDYIKRRAWKWVEGKFL